MGAPSGANNANSMLAVKVARTNGVEHDGRIGGMEKAGGVVLVFEIHCLNVIVLDILELTFRFAKHRSAIVALPHLAAAARDAL